MAVLAGCAAATEVADEWPQWADVRVQANERIDAISLPGSPLDD
jgi:hypothetical protein